MGSFSQVEENRLKQSCQSHITFTFSHLADAFIQSDLHLCTQVDFSTNIRTPVQGQSVWGGAVTSFFRSES